MSPLRIEHVHAPHRPAARPARRAGAATGGSSPTRACAPRLLPALAALVLAALALTACGTPPSEAVGDAAGPATLVFTGGPVHTVDPDLGTASALAVVDGHIAWVGDAADAGSWVGPHTRVVDLVGRALLPGFEDGHMHLDLYAHFLANVDLFGTRSFDEVIERIAARAADTPPGEWVVGRGWDQNDWEVQDFPHHQRLSQRVPDHPVMLERVDGHAQLVNARAMEAFGIPPDIESPPGGLILRDDRGQLTGLFIDAAAVELEDALPQPSREVFAARLRRAIATLHAQGITAIHDAGQSRETIEVYAELARAGDFALRDHVMVSQREPALALPTEETGWPTDDLTGHGRIAVRAIKAYADGALGSRGAALLEPYTDDPENVGLMLTTRDELSALARFALDREWQLCTHAIGDRANRLVLDVYEEALAERDDVAPSPRFRIEHAQVLHPRDVERFARLGVMPSMQAQHLTSDMPWARERVGRQRMAGAYAWRSLLDSGVIIPGGSDCPVEAPDPIAALCAAVTRSDKQGVPPGGWDADQAMTRAEALAHLTVWPAQAAFAEDRRGTLTPGKVADLVVLSGDPMTLPDEQLPGLRALLTVFDGEVVYEALETGGGAP